MKRILTILLLLIASVTYSQTNATFNNLDVRNKSTFRGYHYIYDSTFFKPTGSNIPWWDATDTLGFVLSVSNPNESQLVKVRLSTLLDSLGITGGADSLYIAFGCFDNLDTWLYNSDTIYIDTCQLWYLDGDTIINVSDYKVRMTDEVYIYPLPPEATKTGRMMHINQFGQVEWMSPATLVDTLNILMPQYWTFVDSATDTLKNNVALSGVVAIKGNLELQTTNAGATEGVIKQNGVNLMHTYHEKGDNNLFIGQGAGNFTADSSFNVGIGRLSLSNISGVARANTTLGSSSGAAVTTGIFNTLIGYNAGTLNQDGIQNTFIGSNAGQSNVTGDYNVAVGYNALNLKTGDYNVAIGKDAMSSNSGTGVRNVGVGQNAISGLTSGNDNVSVGNAVMNNNKEGEQNTAIGANALYSNIDNDGSTAVGYRVMYYADSRSTGERITYNTAIGYETMKGSTTAANNTGQYNTATGYQALDGMTSGSFNTVYGYDAGGGITTGDSNILIGTSAGSQLTTQSDQLYIDNTNTTTPLIYGNMRTDALTFNGDITYGDTFWDDLTVPATQARIGATSTPAFNYDSLALLWDNTPVDTTTQLIVLNYQLPHRWKAGSSVYLHVHYLQHSAADTCEFFKATYKWTDMGETRAGAYTTVKTDNQTVYTYTSNALHQLASFPAISGAGHTESSILQIVLYCYSDANLYSLDTDIHFEIDKPGSDAQFP